MQQTINIAPDPITELNIDKWLDYLEDSIRDPQYKGVACTIHGLEVCFRGPRHHLDRTRTYFAQIGPFASPPRKTFTECKDDVVALLNIVRKYKKEDEYEGDRFTGDHADVYKDTAT